MKEKGVSHDDSELIMKELKQHSIALNELIEEIKQLKQIILLIRQNFYSKDPSYLSSPLIDSKGTFPSITSSNYSFQNEDIEREQSLINDQTNMFLNIEEIKKNLTKSDIIIIHEHLSKAGNYFNNLKLKTESKNYSTFIEECYRYLSTVVKILKIILKMDKEVDNEKNDSLFQILKQLGPVPIILDPQVVEFISEKIKTDNYVIGSKTAERIIKILNNTNESLNELISYIGNP